MTRILYIITQADGGGAQKYVLTLAKHFNGMIAAGDEARKLFDDAHSIGIKIHKFKHLKRNINPWHDLMAVFEIKALIKQERPKIVHLNSTKAGLLGSLACALIAKSARPKVIFTAHGFKFLEPLSSTGKWFYLQIEKFASKFRGFIITVSDVDRRAALENKLIDENKIKTIYNGIGQIEFLSKEEARSKLGLPQDKRIYGVIANDYESKGLDLLKELKPVEGTMIAVIGKVNPDKQSNDFIKYLGYKENAATYVKGFNGTFMPSRKEGFPYVALEALQAGQPIAATNVGGNKEAIGDAGILIKPNDVRELQRVIEVEFFDLNITQKLSEKALERSKLFTEEKMLEETKKIYESL